MVGVSHSDGGEGGGAWAGGGEEGPRVPGADTALHDEGEESDVRAVPGSAPKSRASWPPSTPLEISRSARPNRGLSRSVSLKARFLISTAPLHLVITSITPDKRIGPCAPKTRRAATPASESSSARGTRTDRDLATMCGTTDLSFQPTWPCGRFHGKVYEQFSTSTLN